MIGMADLPTQLSLIRVKLKLLPHPKSSFRRWVGYMGLLQKPTVRPAILGAGQLSEIQIGK